MGDEGKSELLQRAPPDPSVVAVIRFATDSAAIPKLGMTVLEQLARIFAGKLDRERIFFTCVGTADHRAGFTYNLALGLRRATAVKNVIDQLFRSKRNYSGIAAFSTGELFANQKTRDRASLAADRQVLVHASESNLPPTPPPVAQHPKVWRTSRRSFAKTTFENVSRPDPARSDFNDGVSGTLSIIRGGEQPFQNVWGSQTGSDKQFLDASYRVNRVVQSYSFREDSRGAALIMKYKADLTYEWGPPRPLVQVDVIKDVDEGSDPDRTTAIILRAKADADWLITPPDP